MTRRPARLPSLLVAAAACAAGAIFTIGHGNGFNPSSAAPSTTSSASSANSSATAAPVTESTAHAALQAAGLVDASTHRIRVDAVRELLTQLSASPHEAPDYDRDLFGQRWADIDRNGCDTRNDLLARDLLDLTFKPGTHDCVVLAGTLHDPYTGVTIEFARGEGTSELVPIDHIVPLSWAWTNGAANWSPEQREQFANDPMNLQATVREANSSKVDRGPSEWLPPATDYHCTYIARYVLVASTYKLAMPGADAASTNTVLDGCEPA